MESFDFFVFRLKHLKGLSNPNLLRIMKHYYTEEKLWLEASGTEISYVANLRMKQREIFLVSWADSLSELAWYYRQFKQQGMIHFLSPAYSDYLKEIYNPPAALFYIGDLRYLKSPSLAVVGARQATSYGLAVTRELIPDLVAAGLTIVSGLARGVDTSAHQQTIRNQGQTIGVLGSGLDYIYPKENFRLQRYLGDYHLLLSEYPIGTPPRAYHFPARNRIIAGLALGTCIIEAKARSGSLITAQLALEAGREVFAVPGNILSNHSLGTNELIQMGAKCIRNSGDILVELNEF